MTVELYHLNNSRSHRIVWLLEELEFDYSIANSNSHNLPSSILPLKYPTIHLLDIGIYLTETSAICEFLANSHKSLGFDLCNVDYYFWKNYADSSFMQTLVLKQVFKQIVVNTPLPFKPITWLLKKSFDQMYLNNALKDQLKRIEDHLQLNSYICGDRFSYVDILIWFPIEASLKSMPKDDYPYIAEYLTRLKTRTAFIAAKEKGHWSDEEFSQYWL